MVDVVAREVVVVDLGIDKIAARFVQVAAIVEVEGLRIVVCGKNWRTTSRDQVRHECVLVR